MAALSIAAGLTLAGCGVFTRPRDIPPPETAADAVAAQERRIEAERRCGPVGVRRENDRNGTRNTDWACNRTPPRK